MQNKSKYVTPELTVYGTVESLTQALGSSSASDTVFIGQNQFPGSDFGLDGSKDACLAPVPGGACVENP